MRRIIAIALIFAFHIVGLSEAAKALNSAPEQLAQATPPSETTTAPEWRFDEKRALETIRAHGFYGVRDLKQTLAGVWKGQAIRYGKLLTVEVDQTGNFSEYTP